MSVNPLPEWLSATGVSADISDIVIYIRNLRNDLTDFHPLHPGSTHIPGARAELGAVVETTEEAANKIMDACDSLGQALNSKDAQRDEKFNAAINAIYEACSFQDLTSQRVTKVQRTLDTVENRLTELAQKLGIDPQSVSNEIDPPANDEHSLMNGPALPGNGIDQTNIDKLLIKGLPHGRPVTRIPDRNLRKYFGSGLRAGQAGTKP